MARLTLRLLGPFQATLDGKPATGFVSDKARGLLAYLVVEAGRPHRRETLAGLLWPDYPESSARTSLRRALANVRAVIGDRRADRPTLLISRHTIQVSTQSDYGLDVSRFVELAKGTGTISEQEEALELYRGDFMEGFSVADSPAFEEWLLLCRESHRRQLVRFLYRLSQEHEALGANERALHYARRQITLEPYRESAHRQVMRLLALDGQRGEALAHYGELRSLLRSDLDVDPAPQTQALRAQIVAEESPALVPGAKKVPPVARVQALPAQVTRFLGRKREMKEVKKLLGGTRLLTLTGPPGIGKSRLALEVAAEVQDKFADGVYFVDLAVLSDPALVASAISRCLGFRAHGGRPLLETLTQYLSKRSLLLLLDNFEQIIEAGPLVGELLASAPGLTALVTSREALQIYGEQQYPVPSLQLPDLSGQAAPDSLSQIESVALFVQRARAVQPSFELSEANAAAVADICIRLDGLPLAIELAAARCKLFTPEMIRARLKNRLDILVGGSRDLSPRQRALRAAIDWSYNLLDESEQRLLSRLSVFQGGRTAAKAEDVCAASLSVPIFEGLESLYNKNLIRQEPGLDGEPRFVMLETIHEYARECLDQSGEAETIGKRHARTFALMAERSEDDLFGAEADVCCIQLRAEIENLRTALTWCLKHGDVEMALRMAGSLREFWYGEGLIDEGLRWLEDSLVDSAGAPPAVRAKAMNAAGMLATVQGDHKKGQRHLEQALELARESDDESNIAWALVHLGGGKTGRPGEYEEGIAYCEEALALFRKLDDKPGAIQALTMAGELARLSGDYRQARAAYEECLVVSRQSGHRLREALTHGNLASVAMHEGDYDRAERLAKEDMRLLRELDLKYHVATGFAIWAGPLVAKGEAERATCLLGAADGLLEDMGLKLPPSDQLEVDGYLERVREQLTAADFEAAWALGRTMSVDDAFAYASGGQG